MLIVTARKTDRELVLTCDAWPDGLPAKLARTTGARKADQDVIIDVRPAPEVDREAVAMGVLTLYGAVVQWIDRRTPYRRTRPVEYSDRIEELRAAARRAGGGVS